MSLFGALDTSVAGMRAQSLALRNISGNIANSQTPAFKRAETSFADLVPSGEGGAAGAGSVIAHSRATNGVAGDIQNAAIGTYMAISGSGFFVVRQPTGSVDGRTVLAGPDVYTRRGDFELDSDGFLVNGAGYYLMGVSIDPATGNPMGSSPSPLQFGKDFVEAKATSKVSYRANLAKTPLTQDYDASVTGSELIDPAHYSASPLGPGATIIGDESDQFLSESVSGGSLSVFSTAGDVVTLQLRWAKTDSVESGTADTWNLFYQVDSDATGSDIAWMNVGTDYVFDVNGKLDPPVDSFTLTGATIDGIAIGDIEFDHGNNGVTQFGDPSGTVNVSTIQQNGYAAGELVSISISDSGRIIGSYSNGETIDLAEVTLADFNNPNGLKRLDGGAFQETAESGSPILGASGKVVGAALEAANVDISEEFTKLIVTQQAYSANARVITIAREMAQETINVIR